MVSICTAALLGSAASPALAVVESGIYIGGAVDHYYTVTSFIMNSEQALQEIVEAGFDHTVYVHDDHRGASILELIEAGSLFDALHQLTPSYFDKDGYTVMKEDGSEGGVIHPSDLVSDFSVIDIE